MTITLRIETQLEGELASVPFVWTTGPREGPGRKIDSLAKRVPAYLKLIKGTRSISPLPNGRIQEAWSVYATGGNIDTSLGEAATSTQRHAANENVRKDVARLTHMFKIANRINNNDDSTDIVYLVEQTDGEKEFRKAPIYSGSIAPIDHNVASREMGSGVSLYAVTVERDIEWEHGEIVITDKGGVAIDNHGGKYVLPDIFSSLGSESRIPNLTIRPYTGFIKSLWLGFKANKWKDVRVPNSGTSFYDWNPKISIGSSALQTASIIINPDSRYKADTDFQNSAKIVTDFSNTSDWATRFKNPMWNWNNNTFRGPGDTAEDVEAYRNFYAGTYHLLLRYRISGDPTAVCGIRFGTGWETESGITWGTRMYLSPSLNSKGDHQIRYVDMGLLTIGGNNWNSMVRDRMVLEQFAIYWQAAKLRGNSNTRLEWDIAWLVPNDNFLYLELENEIDSSKRIELFTDSFGEIFGYVVESGLGDYPGIELVSKRKVYSAVTNITYNNWRIPFEPGSLLVVVGDRDESETKELSSKNRVDISGMRLTEAYAYRNA